MAFKVTSMTLKSMAPNKGGTTIKADFDANNGDIGFRGCRLVQDSMGRWKVWTPGIVDLTRSDRRALTKDVWLRNGGPTDAAIFAAATTAYRALTGNDDGPCQAIEDSLTEAGIDG